MEFIHEKLDIAIGTNIDSQINIIILKIRDVLQKIIITRPINIETDISNKLGIRTGNNPYDRRIYLGTIGYFQVPLNVHEGPLSRYVCSDEIKNSVMEKIQSLDDFSLLLICKIYKKNDYNLTKYYYKLKELLHEKTVQENKKLNEKIKDLSNKIDDFMNLFNDVGDLNSEKIEKQ